MSSYSLSQALLLLLDGADPDSETSRQILEYIFQYGGDASAPAPAPSAEASGGVASPSTSGGAASPDDPLSAMGDINAQSAALASDLLRVGLGARVWNQYLAPRAGNVSWPPWAGATRTFSPLCKRFFAQMIIASFCI